MGKESHKNALRIALKLEMGKGKDKNNLGKIVRMLSAGLTSEDIEECMAVVQAELYTEQE
jgi:hypothetical protein